MQKPVVIVGAGLAGLVAARRLHEAQVPFLLMDADDRPGGRLKTDTVNGFRLDRGFQTLFTAYPTAQAELDFRALDLQVFAPGAQVFDGSKRHGLQFDRRDISLILFNRFIGWPDKFRMGAWAKHLEDSTEDDLRHEEDVTAELYLRRYGFSEALLDGFLRPFYGGIFLDRSLSFSSRQFNWVSKMLLEGDTVVPASGIEAIPRQLASGLPAASLLMRTRVEGVRKENGRVTGVSLSTGEFVDCTAVIVATDPAAAARLAGIAAPLEARGSTCLYFETPSPISKSKTIVLNGSGDGLINHLVPVSNVCPRSAPAGRHLVSVTLLGAMDRSNGNLEVVAKKELEAWFPEAAVKRWDLLKVVRVRNAQMAQPPGFDAHAPKVQTDTNLYLAGEFTDNSSIESALRSGDRCGRVVVDALRAQTV